jgi:hypothetical protein
MKTITFRLCALAAAIFMLGKMSAGALPSATGPTNQTVPYGDPASLSVSASGSGPLFYQWQFNGTDLSKNVLGIVAGNGGTAFSADGTAATNAGLDWPGGLVAAPEGSMYIIDHDLVRKISTNGIITTVAGGGSYEYGGVSATNAKLYEPNCLALGTNGNLYVSDDGQYFEGRVSKIDTSGIITTLSDGLGDGAYGLAVDGAGNVYVAGMYDPLVWKINTTNGVSIVAGTAGLSGYSGDGGAATNAQLDEPTGLAMDGSGNLYIADQGSNCIRKVSANGIITTVAGAGRIGYWGDGGAATNASLNGPSALAVDGAGDVFIVDGGNKSIRMVSTNGTISTVAGTGCLRSITEGEPAIDALLAPLQIACDALGNLYFGDNSSKRVCEVPVVSGWPVFLKPCATTDDTGTYKVIVTDSSGSVTNSAALTVTPPTTTDEWVAAGTRALSAWDLDAGYAAFQQAVALSPADPEANARACISRFFLITRQPAVSNYLASRFEISPGKLYAYNWVGSAEYDTNGTIEVIDSVVEVLGYLLNGAHVNTNASLNSADVISLFNTNIMPAILACDTNMANIADRNYTITLTTNDTHLAGSVTFDHGDFMVLRSLVQLLSIVSDTSQAFNFDFDVNHLLSLYNSNALTVERFLADYPDFLDKTANLKTEVAASKTALTTGAGFYFEGSGFIRTNRATNAIRLFNFDRSLTNFEAEFRDYLGKALTSLQTPVVFDTNNDYAVYLGGYFNSTNSVRDYLPAFSGNSYVPNSLPDYTLHGILQGVPAYKTESVLRDNLDFTFAGIYSTNLPDSAGWVMLFLQTNAQATVLAFVPGYAAGIYDSFTFTDPNDLTWLQTNNGVIFDLDCAASLNLSFNSIDDIVLKSFSGSLEATNWSFYEDIPTCSPVSGAFEDYAGVYSGTWTNTSSGLTGQMKGILGDDGSFCCATFAPTGEVGDGGAGFFPTNTSSSLVCSSAQGFQVTNTLDRARLKMSGVFVSANVNEVFSLTRTDFIAHDTKPSITSAPANQRAIVGGEATFQVAASGSAPLCYQWYSNGVAIIRATNTTLVLSNLTSAGIAATYSVEVENVVGSAQASATLSLGTKSTPPKLAITSPKAGQSVSNALLLVTGTVTYKVAVNEVYYQLNGGSWTPATPGHSWSNWTASVTLSNSANSISAYAVDSNGSLSPTETVNFKYIPSATLYVQTNGNGTFNPKDNGKLLAIGSNYTLTASAGKNWIFSNWVASGSGNFVSNNPILKFNMQSNLVLTANFVTNVFLAAEGIPYNGLFAPVNAPREQANSGAITFTVTSAGVLSGKLTIGANTPSLSGQFNPAGAVTITTPRKGLSTLTTALQLDFATQTATGSVTDGSFEAQVMADLDVFNSTHKATNYEGQYTLVIPGANDSTVGPFGTSCGTVTVSPLGAITFAWSLADGTSVSPQSSVVSKDGYWPFYLPLYKGNGSVWSWNCFTNGAIISGTNASWINATNPTKNALYPTGFTNEAASIFGSAYNSTNKPLLALTNGLVILEGGDVPAITNRFILTPKNTITLTNAADTNKLTLTINKSTGVISGSFANPSSPKQTIKINGVLLQNQTNAQGYFPGTNQSGTFMLMP